MCARRATGAAKCHDFSNLCEREAKAPTLGDEFQNPERVLWVDTIAGRRPLRRREDTPGFVQPKRLRRDTGSPSDITDEQTAIPHGPRINLVAWGKVKRATTTDAPVAREQLM